MKNPTPLQCQRPAAAPARRQHGVFAVEFALVVIVFFVMVMGIIEVSRALYMWNTLQEVTRRAARAATTTDFSNAGAMGQLRRDAMFSGAKHNLAFGAPVTDEHIVIDYLSLQTGASGSKQVPIAPADMPACPARNRVICTADSNSPSCIRFVRVRVCKPNTKCTPVPHETLVSVVKLPMNLPLSTTIMKAESLGYSSGMPMCD